MYFKPYSTDTKVNIKFKLSLNIFKSKCFNSLIFLLGDNSDIVATDSQKNTVYLLAKKHGVENPEKFALLLATHFLNKYAHVAEAHIHVEEYPWQRICKDEIGNNSVGCPNFSTFNNRSKHNHAFIFTPTETHYCDVVVKRTGKSFSVYVSQSTKNNYFFSFL